MFRKLMGRISAAATSAANAVLGSDDQGEQALQNMGFHADDVRNALLATNGNMELAAELLLASTAPCASQQGAPPRRSHDRNNHNEAEMNTALQESSQVDEARQLDEARNATDSASAQKRQIPSIAAIRTGHGAVLQLTSGEVSFQNTAGTGKSVGCTSLADVEILKRRSHKPKEAQLLRCADRMKSYPLAVDSLRTALMAVQRNPDDEKFRIIDKTTSGYQRSIAKAPGAEDLLKAINFKERGKDKLVLLRDEVDLALVFLGISALETSRQTTKYKEGKRKLQFEKQIQAIFSQSGGSEQEAIQRAYHMSKCPSEPNGGRGALIQVKVGADSEPFRRKFDADDTLKDILNWLGAVASAIPDKLVSREWSLVDLNQYPMVPTDCEEDRNKTLQNLGFFPSGLLEVVPSSEAWHNNESLEIKMRSKQGCGADGPVVVL